MEGGIWVAAWEAALDELELSLDEAERLLEDRIADEVVTPRGWVPPAIPAPLPAPLVQRARDLQARQQLVLAATVAVMSDARRNVALLDRVADVSGNRRAERPVYVDVRT